MEVEEEEEDPVIMFKPKQQRAQRSGPPQAQRSGPLPQQPMQQPQQQTSAYEPGDLMGSSASSVPINISPPRLRGSPQMYGSPQYPEMMHSQFPQDPRMMSMGGSYMGTYYPSPPGAMFGGMPPMPGRVIPGSRERIIARPFKANGMMMGGGGFEGFKEGMRTDLE